MDYDKKASEQLLSEDDLSARKAVGLLNAAYEVKGQDKELYRKAKTRVEEYIDNTPPEQKTYGCREEIELDKIRDILTELRTKLTKATERAYGMDESNRQLIEDTQQGCLFRVKDNIVHNGDQVF